MLSLPTLGFRRVLLIAFSCSSVEMMLILFIHCSTFCCEVGGARGLEAGDGGAHCQAVALGHQRDRDLQLRIVGKVTFHASVSESGTLGRIELWFGTTAISVQGRLLYSH